MCYCVARSLCGPLLRPYSMMDISKAVLEAVSSAPPSSGWRTGDNMTVPPPSKIWGQRHFLLEPCTPAACPPCPHSCRQRKRRLQTTSIAWRWTIDAFEESDRGLPLRLTSGMLAEAIRASLVVIEAGDLALEQCDRQPFLRPVYLACLATGRSAPRPPQRSSGSPSSPAPRGAHAFTPRTVTRLRRLCLFAYALTQARSSPQGSRQGPPAPAVNGSLFCPSGGSAEPRMACSFFQRQYPCLEARVKRGFGVREDPCCARLSCHAARPQCGAALHQQDASGDNGFVCILTRCPRRPFLKD